MHRMLIDTALMFPRVPRRALCGHSFPLIFIPAADLSGESSSNHLPVPTISGFFSPFFFPLYNPPLSLSLLLISSFLFCPLSTPPLALPLNFSVPLVPLIPSSLLPLFILLPLGFSIALLAAFPPLLHCIHVFFSTLVSQTFFAIFVAQDMMQSLCFRRLFVFFWPSVPVTFITQRTSVIPLVFVFIV